MELWRQILNSTSSDEVSILDTDVTGIKGSDDTPDGVFYTEFSEEEAVAYHKIFSNFVELYGINTRIAVSGLVDDLNLQNAAVVEKFCPIELILFSSRYANNIIESDPDQKVFKKLKIIVGKLLNTDAMKIAQYILGGWEWKTQLSIFVEAIGVAAPELVDVAMEHYSHIATMCADDDKTLLKSYVNMLISTQDESFAGYFSDVTTNEVFMNDNEVIDYFCRGISKDSYWRNEDVFRQIVEEIEGRAISPILRKRISDLKRQILKDDTRAEATIHGMLNSKNIDYETKVEWVNKLHFVGACATDLYEWEMTRDPDISVLINNKVMDNIDSIIPDEIKARAYIALATHSKRHKEEIIDFLLKQKEATVNFKLPIEIALFDLRVVSSEELFNSLFVDSYQEFHGKTLGKYFRYNKVAISNDFISYLKRYLSNSLDENTLDKALQILFHVLEAFNRRDGMIANESFGIADNIMKILLPLNGNFNHSSTYDSFMDILDLISKESPSSKSDVLKILYKFKDNVSKKSNMPSIEFRIDRDIKKLDIIVAPTGD